MKKLIIAFAIFVLAGAVVFGVVVVTNPGKVSLPQTLDASSPCPAAQCASGGCHSFDNVPEPDGVHEMTCPEAGCASVECHAWDTLADRYCQASDASLTLWVFVPVALVVSLVIVIKRM